jgi:uncharacterized protein
VPAPELALAILVVVVGSIVQGAVGFGSNLVAAPLLVLIEPKLVPGATLVASMVLNSAVARREREHADRRELRIAVAGLVPGSFAGAALLLAVDARSLALLLGAVVLAGVAVTASRMAVPASPAAIGTAGFISGVMGTAVAIGGPPLALLHQHRPGPVIRATLARLFFISSVLSVIGLLTFGAFDAGDLGRGLALAPGSLVGFALSRPVARAIDRGYARNAVLVLSTATALLVIATHL